MNRIAIATASWTNSEGSKKERTFDDKPLAEKPEGVTIIYGFPGRKDSLGDFGKYAKTIKNEKINQYGKDNFDIVNIQDKETFFNHIQNFKSTFLIKELHVISHAFGAGLSLEYESEAGDKQRRNFIANNAIPNNANMTIGYDFDEFVNAEPVLTTDFILTKNIQSKKNIIRSKFAGNAIVKIWGCNSGVANWQYSDEPPEYYLYNNKRYRFIYWGTLMKKNIPKPALAQAFADYFHLNAYGATSGSHIEVYVNNKWIDSEAAQHKGLYKWTLPHRLHPDKGDYVLFTPK